MKWKEVEICIFVFSLTSYDSVGKYPPHEWEIEGSNPDQNTEVLYGHPLVSEIDTPHLLLVEH